MKTFIMCSFAYIFGTFTAPFFFAFVITVWSAISHHVPIADHASEVTHQKGYM